MRKRLLLSAGAFVCLLCGCVAVVGLTGPQKVKAESFAQIKEGMYLQEVEQLLGHPTKDQLGMNPNGIDECKLWGFHAGSQVMWHEGNAVICVVIPLMKGDWSALLSFQRPVTFNLA